MKCTGLTRACLAPDLWHIPALCSLPATSPYRPLASSLCLSPPRSHSLPRSVSLTLSSPSLSLSPLCFPLPINNGQRRSPIDFFYVQVINVENILFSEPMQGELL